MLTWAWPRSLCRVIVTTFLLSSMAIAAQSFGDGLKPKLQHGYRPARGTDEGGLWMAVEDLERQVQQSPLLVREERLNEYIRDIVCELAREYCQDIRVYILRNPYFNASMYPNGMMHIWSGLLLRVENEAQLATVLGHEIGHYLLTHSIERWRAIRSSTSFAAFLNLGLAAGGAGDLGTLVNMGVLAGISSFSRENERDADQYGLKLLAETGYQPREAAAVWEQIIREDAKAAHKRKRNIFTASHPSSKERVKNLLEYAQRDYPDVDNYQTYQDRYVKRVTPHFFSFMEDEIKIRQYGRTEALLDMLFDSNFPRAELFYFKGELFRLRNQDGDKVKALEAYNEATLHPDTPAEVFRQLGYMHLKGKSRDAAYENFKTYLKLEPAASDREMVNFYIENME